MKHVQQWIRDNREFAVGAGIAMDAYLVGYIIGYLDGKR